MTITEPRVAEPQAQSDHHFTVHTTCCRDENKALCGIVPRNGPPQPGDLECVTCDDLEAQGFCPVYLSCSDTDWSLS